MNQFFSTETLLTAGQDALNLIVEEHHNLESKAVVPDVKPGFLRHLLPEEAPEKAENMKQIIQDTRRIIIPNLTQWQHPNFFAYFPSNMNHGTIVGDMISMAFNTPGFTWIASPASTELENIVVDWIVKLLGLPENFLIKNQGGGMIANTMGDAIFLSVHAAKHKKMVELGIDFTDVRMLKFVGYYTAICHSQSHKGLYIKDIPYRREIPVYYDERVQNYQIKVEEFEKMVEKDISEGLIPFWVGTIIGSTSLGCNDPLAEISKVCKKHKIWMNVDAAWAGAALVVPEIREEVGKGLEGADSMAINFGKWNMCGNNSAVFFVADKTNYTQSLLGGPMPEYLKNQFSGESDIIDYKDWQVGLSRRFNSLRFWYMIRSLGVEGMRKNITEKIELAKVFENLLKQNPRFEMVCKRELSLICFRLVKDKEGNRIPTEKINEINKKLLDSLNNTNKYYLVASVIRDIYFLRFVICNHGTTQEHVKKIWHVIEDLSMKVFDN